MKGININSLLWGFILSVFLFGGKAAAQKTLIDVSIDSAAILIGEQTVLHVSVTTDKGKKVLLTIPPDTLMTGVEVLSLSAPDTTETDNNRLIIKQDILITSFDSALYLLPPLKVIDQADTIYSKQVALKVSTLPVQADAPDKFYDIKGVWQPPFVLADYYPLIFGVLLTLFLICVIGYILQRIRNKKSLLPLKKEEPKLPPHEQAIKELEEIKQRKLWQQGRSKEYYTAITDTLRKYLIERFDINALEMTSGEIMNTLQSEPEAAPVYNNLKQILLLSDFVKFAKMNPLPDENDLSMANAYEFVERTKRIEAPPAEKPEQTEKEKTAEESKLKE
ncbi:hypothetical protein [Parabacteroides sp. Marseille-P3160]|uniref:hypothetical protein n=1 Tax=Parabacteroides sp. Marseille-P3160 TaxID=1917887 RepID=UPI0009BB51DF|nr:hypothetical protein [Parabacteroides sp. Marseille-P3160]